MPVARRGGEIEKVSAAGKYVVWYAHRKQRLNCMRNPEAPIFAARQAANYPRYGVKAMEVLKYLWKNEKWRPIFKYA